MSRFKPKPMKRLARTIPLRTNREFSVESRKIWDKPSIKEAMAKVFMKKWEREEKRKQALERIENELRKTANDTAASDSGVPGLPAQDKHDGSVTGTRVGGSDNPVLS